MKTKKILSLLLCILMVFSIVPVMNVSAVETTIYEVKDATELNNAFKIAARNSGIRLMADITSEQAFAVIKNKGSIAIDLNGYSITGKNENIGDFITVGDNTTLLIANTHYNKSSIVVNSKVGGTSALCVNGENAALNILNGIEILMGTDGNYGMGSNYAYCIKVVKGKELIVNGTDIYNWMYWGRGIAFSNYDDGAFDNFTFKVLSDSEITAKVACIEFSLTNSLPGKSRIEDCDLSYETALPWFDDGTAAPKADFRAINAVDDDFVLGDALADGYIAEYANMGAYVDNKALIKNFPTGVNVLINPCYDHEFTDIVGFVKRTCTEDGYTTYECPTCYAKNKVTLPAEGHSYYTVFETPATCGKDGEKAIKCSICGDQPEVEKNSATGNHTYSGDRDADCENCGFNRTDDCACKCHGNIIQKLIFLITNFIPKLFGRNKICACGVKH